MENYHPNQHDHNKIKQKVKLPKKFLNEKDKEKWTKYNKDIKKIKQIVHSK